MGSGEERLPAKLVDDRRSNGFDVIRQHGSEPRRDGDRTFAAGTVLEFGPLVRPMADGQSPVIHVDVGDIE